MNAIYVGRVVHNRAGKHRLRYNVFMLALDVDTLDALDRRLRLFSHNRRNLIALHDCDHAERIKQPIRPQIEARLREADIDWEGGGITLLTMPRVLNYAFNPLSVYFCWRRGGDLAAIVHEVSNTFGERHFYAMAPEAILGECVTQSCSKNFFVSPFLEMGLRYEFNILPPGEAVRVAMRVMRGEECVLTASFAGKRRALSDANLLCAWAGNPLMTFKVIAGIHWEALKLFLKGVRYVGRESALSGAHARQRR
jgi:uncharacterized protein